MGALVVDQEREPHWSERVLELTEGCGADVFVDIVGGPSHARAVSATRFGGRVAMVGFVAGRASTLDLVTTIQRAVTLQATSGGSRRSFEALVRTIDRCGIHPVVDRVFPFTRSREAYQYLADGRPFGKVVISFEGV
jgi:NADPH:quinone reductase-like Zn-dependent oxidoreductase